MPVPAFASPPAIPFTVDNVGVTETSALQQPLRRPRAAAARAAAARRGRILLPQVGGGQLGGAPARVDEADHHDDQRGEAQLGAHLRALNGWGRGWSGLVERDQDGASRQASALAYAKVQVAEARGGGLLPTLLMACAPGTVSSDTTMASKSGSVAQRGGSC